VLPGDIEEAAPAAAARALDRVVEELYADLRRLAGAVMAREGAGHTLQATAVVHEAWMRLARTVDLDVTDRKRFMVLAARVMRQVLVDHARGKRRVKRGGGQIAIELREESTPAVAPPSLDLLALDQALERLGALDPRPVEIIDLRFVVGLEVEEVATLLDTSPATVKRETAMARAWLLASIGGGAASDGRG
jgi:RNA polymerase sigma factor (TIGR02999 family)